MVHGDGHAGAGNGFIGSVAGALQATAVWGVARAAHPQYKLATQLQTVDARVAVPQSSVFAVFTDCSLSGRLPPVATI
jgi:hypothetical protein